jgi:hypothetical protein
MWSSQQLLSISSFHAGETASYVIIVMWRMFLLEVLFSWYDQVVVIVLCSAVIREVKLP